MGEFYWYLKKKGGKKLNIYRLEKTRGILTSKSITFTF